MPKPTIYWIPRAAPHRLALSARPAGGQDLDGHIAGWREAGVTMVLSLLESHESRSLELQHEPVLCQVHGIEYWSFPIRDHGTPTSPHAVARLMQRLVQRLHDAQAALIHCRAGIGRSGLIAACAMHQLTALPVDDIFTALTSARGLGVPETTAQAQWVREFVRQHAV